MNFFVRYKDSKNIPVRENRNIKNGHKRLACGSSPQCPQDILTKKQKGHETEDFHRAWRGHGACAHIRLFADVRELRSVVQEEQREGTAHTQGGYREGRTACEV